MQLKSRSKTWSVLLPAAVLGAATLWMAVPRLAASIRFVPVDRAIARYHESGEIPSQRLLTLIGFARQAGAIHDHYRFHEGISFLQFLRGLDVRTPALQRRDAYRAAEAEAMATLRRAPLQPVTWLRVATVRAVLHDEPATVIAPWRMSVFTGRTHSTLLVPRIALILPFVADMETESRAMLHDQLLLAWDMKPGDLAAALRVADPGLTATRALLGGTDPAALEALEARVEAAR